MDSAGREAAGKLGSYGFSPGGPERTMADILKDIAGNFQGIVRSEVRLARAELADEGRKAIQASTMLAAGAVLGLFGLGFLLWTIVFALSLVVPLWAATLIVGVLLAVGCAAAIAVDGSGGNMPVKTMQTVKEDVEWTKEQARS